MSIDYMRRVWANEELRDGALLLMLALADHANDAGECWPSQPHLVIKTRLTDRHVRRLIDRLADEGYIKVINQGRGRGRKAQYRLFPDPIKADILSEEKRTYCPNGEIKADICDAKSGHLEQVKADICDTKADIGDEIQSHARSESPIEPPIEPPIESSSLGNEDERRMAVHQAWRDHYADAMPANLIVPIDGLTVECGPAAVIHGIVTSKSRNSRNFQYIASCARNYVPEPPTASYAIDLSRRSTPSYAVEPISAQPFDLSPTPAARPAPLAHDDPWRICLAELSMTLPNMAVTYLAGSVLEPAGEVPAANGAFVPLYRVVVGECAAAGLGWLKHQGAEAIRRRLSSVLGQSVLVEIAVDEPRPASDPP